MPRIRRDPNPDCPDLVEPAKSGFIGSISSTKRLPAGVNAASEVVADLSKAMIRMNELISIAETKFAQTNLGVEVSVPFDDDNEAGWESFVRFARDGKEWRLLVAHSFAGDGEGIPKQWELLANAPRSTRVNALAALPILYEEMVDQARHEAFVLNAHLIQAEDFLATVGRG